MMKSEIERVYGSFRVEFRSYACKALGGDEEAAEDALQETLVRAWAKQNQYVDRYGTSGMYAWLLAILKRVCHEGRRHRNLEHDFDFDEVGEYKEYSDYDAVDDAISREETQRDLADIIAGSRLTNLEWAVVTAKRLGFSNKDIAVGLGITVNCLRAHLSNSLPALRQSATSQGITA